MFPEETAPLFAIFEHSRNPMLLADDDRNYVNVNEAACDLLGYPPGQLVGMRIDDITLPEYRPFLDDTWAAFLARGGSIGVFPVVRADGTTVDVEFNATANVVPGLHLSIFINPLASGAADGLDADADEDKVTDEPVAVLTARGGRLLTDDERTVMTLLALGQNWHDIAADLETDVASVRALTQSSMAKMGARTRAHAVSIAIRAGEITPGQPVD